MHLYLVRHCDAVHPAEHPDRPLSERGRAQAARLRAWIDSANVRVDEVVHSGVLRAQETAEIIAVAARPTQGVREERGLRPSDSPSHAVDRLRHDDVSRIVVTHLPIVAHMAALLLTGTNRAEPLAFHTGTMAAFEGAGDHWALDWMIRPELVPGT